MNWSLSSRVNKLPTNSLALWGASTLTGLLLWFGWPVGPGAPLLFIAWIPLLWLEGKIVGNKAGIKFFLHVWWACLIWNVGTTWWIYYSTAVGSLVAMAANALLMSIPWMLFRYTKKMAGDSWGYLSWVLYWCSFEQIHLNWEISWPWLTLGNGFAMYPEWIQWYEYTGVFGGTIWILLINLGLYQILTNSRQPKGLVAGTCCTLILPILISYILFASYQEKGPEVELVAVQPNIDPYTEKFVDSDNFISFDQQLDRFIQLSKKGLTDSTEFLLWPETAIDGLFDERILLASQLPSFKGKEQKEHVNPIQRLREFKLQVPELSLITGLTSYLPYSSEMKATPTARWSGNFYYDAYNTAYFLSDQGSFETYHKSKLVPGPETMPYPKVFGFLSDLLVDFGGTSGQLAKQSERTVFFNSQGIGLAPAICYESIYGDFMAQYVRNGAHFIGVITNDGWWRDTPGHKQHLHYAVLRAIENRRCVARSANTGISAFINQKGQILQRTNFWEQDVIVAKLKANHTKTFYTLYGDYLGRTAIWLSVLVFLAAWVKRRIT